MVSPCCPSVSDRDIHSETKPGEDEQQHEGRQQRVAAVVGGGHKHCLCVKQHRHHQGPVHHQLVHGRDPTDDVSTGSLDNSINKDCISRMPFRVKHAHLR